MKNLNELLGKIIKLEKLIENKESIKINIEDIKEKIIELKKR